jgi:hypothetical protein
VTATIVEGAARTGRTTRTPSWLRDLALGVRLAVGGGRTSWSRLVLGTIGIGLAVGILLVAASVPGIISARTARQEASVPVTTVRAGVAPVYELNNSTDFDGQGIDGYYLDATGANSPVPPGLARIPAENEVVVSPALAQLLASPQGAAVRPQFPERVIGTISLPGLNQPSELSFYAGGGSSMAIAQGVQKVYGFGTTKDASHQLDPLLLALLVVGVAVLLVPIVIFVGVSSRIAGAQRDRRLAALRLVGAGSRQTRRIAAAESLVSAGTGLVLGTGLFLLAKQIAGSVELMGYSVFSQDVVPSWPLAALVLLVVPVIAVGSSLLALRRTVIEPLGVVRESRPVRRRVWWRLSLLVVGVGAMLLLSRSSSGSQTWTYELAAGAVALLISVPAMLPWLLERAVALFRGGRPSWQLAVRRLQLDSGTPARVVGGVAVVVAGAIALQTVMMAAYSRYFQESQNTVTTVAGQQVGLVDVTTTTEVIDQVTGALQGARGVRGVFPFREVDVQMPSPPGGVTYTDSSGHSYTDTGPMYDTLTLASCPTLQKWFRITDCADGDVFNLGSGASAAGPSELGPGERVQVVDWDTVGTDDQSRQIGSWTVPSTIKQLDQSGSQAGQGGFAGLIVTPGAFGNAAPIADMTPRYEVRVANADSNAVEYVRDALAKFTWRTETFPLYSVNSMNTDQKTLTTIRGGLLVGSLFTLLLAGASLLVLALEQIRERRRPLAALAAAGVPRRMLARSLLWQTMVPVVVGVAVAAVIGLALAWLVLRQTSVPMAIDWGGIGVFAGSAIVLVLLVTGLTLPALRGATKLAALRNE